MFSFLKVSDLGSPTSSTSFIITSLPLLSLVAVTSLLYVLSTFFYKGDVFQISSAKNVSQNPTGKNLDGGNVK